MNRPRRLRLVALGLVGLLLVSSCAGATQAAIEVDGHELSRPDLNEMVVALGSDQSLQANLGFVDPHNGVHDLGAVALVFGLFVQRVFIEDTLESYDESTTAADEQEALLELGEEISTEARDVLLPLFAPVMAMRRVLADNPEIDPELPFGDRYSTTDIRIDPAISVVGGQRIPAAELVARMAARGTVVIIGLASGDPGLCTAATLEAMAQPWPRFLRTARHPSAHLVADATSFDDVYDRRDTFEEVYHEIVETLVDAASKHGEILYAVPGSPNVLERTVELLVADERVDTEVLPAMSFLELAWSRLAIDPIEAGVRLVDGHTFAPSAAGQTGPLLIAHCHNQRVLSDIKLALDDDGHTEVVVLQRLGLPDEAVFSVAWADLDRAVEADHLTSVYVPVLARPVAAELVRFDQMVKTLRAECPWDSVQTHRSLRRHLIEEAYEVLDAIDGFDPETGAGVESLEEELGDLLFQVFLHSAIAAEGGWFELADVARVIHDKLFDRHPHIFDVGSGADAPTLVSWEVAKLAEKDRQSVMDGVATGLPALAYADKVLKKASVVQAPTELEVGRPDDPAIGRALLALVVRARNVDVDPEMALRQEARRLADKVRRYEALAAESDIDVISAEPGMVASLWEAASGA